MFGSSSTTRTRTDCSASVVMDRSLATEAGRFLSACCELEAVRVSHDVAARRPGRGAPARPALAVRATRGVEAQSGDHDVRVSGVRVHGDPLAGPRGPPALEAAGVELGVEQVAAVQR